MTRSSNPVTRNPLLALPSVKRLAVALKDQPPELQAAVNEMLLEISMDCRAKADHSWRKHKAPVAAYWKSIGVIFRHIRLALRVTPGETA